MSSPTYPKTAARRISMQPGSNSSWLLPCACTHSVHMTEILILFLLYSEIFLMHQALHIMFPDVVSVYAGVFAELDHDATRNMIDAQSTTP
jgi:hypothetical protein